MSCENLKKRRVHCCAVQIAGCPHLASTTNVMRVIRGYVYLFIHSFNYAYIYIYMDWTTQVIYSACAHTRNTFYRNTVCVWNHTSKNHAEKAKSAHIRSLSHTHTHTQTHATLKFTKGGYMRLEPYSFPSSKWLSAFVCSYICPRSSSSYSPPRCNVCMCTMRM